MTWVDWCSEIKIEQLNISNMKPLQNSQSSSFRYSVTNYWMDNIINSLITVLKLNFKHLNEVALMSGPNRHFYAEIIEITSQYILHKKAILALNCSSEFKIQIS